MNTLIQTGGAQQSAGIGFAIPINLAKQVAGQLIATGKATHTFLGVASVDVNSQNAAQLGVKVTSGALIQNVSPGSPAAKAGLKRGDVIVKIGGAVIQNSQDMIAEVRNHKPGDKVTVVVNRAGASVDIAVTFGSAQ
jgi:putative serine protease PepD